MEAIIKTLDEVEECMQNKLEVRLLGKAEKIAVIAINQFSGDLQKRALDIAAAISEFQQEYMNCLRE